MANWSGGDDFRPLAKGLKQLVPILKRLSKVTPIVWMMQSPGPLSHHFRSLGDEFESKIPQYNARVRAFFE